MMAESAVEVFVQIAGEDVFAGRLWSHQRRAVESATFTYADEYLRRDGYALDPALPLSAGQHQTRVGQALFGAFTDCSPDRWGRRLINRAEKARARRDGGGARHFADIDYLLGVRDDMRQGALRFQHPNGDAFLASEEVGIPPLVELPRLLNASAKLERDEASDEELRMLLRGGSSLGGARPKAHVIDSGGRAAIAKFPSVSGDDWDVTAWEAVAIELARGAGVRVPTAQLHQIDGKSVLVVERFDRMAARRIGYVSAMTMLEAKDGDQRSYLEIAEVIEAQSPNARDDLRELWRRIALSVLISNTDDHLRNHGFLRTVSAGWELAPAFDLNPDPRPGPKHLSTAIDVDDAASIENLMDVAGYFRVDPDAAREILSAVLGSTTRWRQVAHRVGLTATAIADMAPAFEHAQAIEARRIASGPKHPRNHIAD
jgi:serine/threonine-protein kinase HipA